jgi:hypothetical protein
VTAPWNWTPRARERLAVALLCAFLFGWIGVCLGVTFLQIGHYGYGSGITNRTHLPDQVKVRFGHPEATTPHELMEATSR